MPMHYSNPKRESDPHALPDVETFHIKAEDMEQGGIWWEWSRDVIGDSDWTIEPDDLVGWYWWSCSPGCLPDSDPVGPFKTEAEAMADARDGMDDDDADDEDADEAED